MIITYFGKQFFKIQQGETVVAINPISKDSKHSDKISKFKSNIVLITTNYKDFNGIDSVSYGDKVPFVVSGPGDYEVGNMFIKGILNNTEIAKKNYINTIYLLFVDDIKICFLGAINSKSLSTEAIEEIGSPDIIFVPVGGDDLLSPSDAYKIAQSFEPKIVIPMDYENDKNLLKTFLKEASEEKPLITDKLTLKRKDLEGKDGDVIVLEVSK